MGKISDSIPYELCDEISYLFQIFNGATAAFWE